MKAALYTGTVWHARYAPKPHAFRYRLFMTWLDLDRLDEIFAGRLAWSHRFPTLAWFRRADHYGPKSQALAETVRDTVEAASGVRPTGPIRLLTQLRYFGFYMNPISLYYCYNAQDAQVDHVVAEVHNTPWNERHIYIWPGEVCRNPKSPYRCAKAFHVSPFMEMDHVYRCRLNEPGQELAVHLENEQNGAVVFGAGMVMTHRRWSTRNLTAILIRYPFMTLKIMLAIYVEAFRLWWKGISFQPHPKKNDLLEEPHVP